jgi:hypothetical protein
MGTKKQKKKESHVVRYYGEEGTENEDFWVDVETLGKFNLLGRQGNPPLTKNLAQERTVTLAEQTQEKEFRSQETVRVYGADDSKDLFVEVPMNDTIAVKTGKHYQYMKTDRSFDNGPNGVGNRAVITIRIYRNGIDDQYLTDVTDADGRTTRQPPSEPEKYLEAVHDTDDMGTIDETFYVDLIDKYAMKRERGASFQGIEYNGIWNNCLIYQNPIGSDYDKMPGSAEESGEEPVRLDPLQVVVNFGLDAGKGAIFVAVGGSGMLLYSKIEEAGQLTKKALADRKNKDPDNKNPVFKDLGDKQGSFPVSGVSLGGSATGASYHKVPGGKDADGRKKKDKPAFVICGIYTELDYAERPADRALIMTSEDGKNWKPTFKKLWLTGDPAERNNEAAVNFLAWDKDTFYAAASSDEYWFFIPPESALEVRSYEISLTSKDGSSWSEAGKELRHDSHTGYPHPDGPEPPNLSPLTLFSPHLNSHTKLPDGMAAYWERKNTKGEIIQSVMTKPSKVYQYWYLSSSPLATEYGPSVDIEIFDGKQAIKKTSQTPLPYVLCAGYSSGIFMVGGTDSTGGKAMIASSVDAGDTWNVVFEAESSYQQWVSAIVGAPLKDFPKEQKTPSGPTTA